MDDQDILDDSGYLRMIICNGQDKPNKKKGYCKLPSHVTVLPLQITVIKRSLCKAFWSEVIIQNVKHSKF